MSENKTGFPSIDKPWLKYYSQNAIEEKAFEGNLWKNIYENNKNYLQEVALLYFGKKITYKKLFEETHRAAKAFYNVGVREGDIVLLCMPAIPETIYSILAINKLGATANLLNPLFNEQQMIDRMRETGAKILVVVSEVFDRVEKAVSYTSVETIITLPATNSLGKIISLIKGARRITTSTCWNDFRKKGKNSDYITAPYLPEKPAIVVYSSGTTGASKGIQLTNRSINSTICEGGNIDFEWKRQDIWMNPIPIWFSTGICASILVPLRYGITVLLEPQYDFEIFYKHIVKYKPNFMISASGLYTYLERNHYSEKAYKSFKFLVCGGEYIPLNVENRINNWLKANGAVQLLHKGYGMCECGGTVTCSAYHNNAIGSAGIPTPHVTVAAFDISSNKELTYGQRGEIRVYTPCHMKGYFKNSEETERYFYLDSKNREWCCTSDIGYVDEDGSVYICGRISESYTKDEEVIYLFDIERAVLNHSKVKQCKTVASCINGQTIHVCHLVLEKGANREKVLTEVINQCKDSLEEKYHPHLFKLYCESLPVSLSGKLDIEKMKEDTRNLIEM